MTVELWNFPEHWTPIHDCKHGSLPIQLFKLGGSPAAFLNASRTSAEIDKMTNFIFLSWKIVKNLIVPAERLNKHLQL